MDKPRLAKIEIVTGFSCNNNCMFCSVGDKLRTFDKSTDEVIADIDRALKEKAGEINFTGGEPSIRKDMLELVKHARDGGVTKVRLTTNGRMFSYETFTDMMVGAGLTGATVSLFCNDCRIHDRLTGVRGSYEQTIRGMENLCSRGMVIDVNSVITSETYNLIPDTVKMFLDSVRSVCMIFPTISGHLKDHPELVPRMAQVRPYLTKAMDTLLEAGKMGWTLNYPACFMKGYEKYSSMIELSTRMFWPHEDTDLDQKKRQDNVQVRACKSCRYRLMCTGVMKEYVALAGEGEIVPVRGSLVKSLEEYD
jgi:MoaA/NifB/PqqE/SkfB family radical SAM enzyme